MQASYNAVYIYVYFNSHGLFWDFCAGSSNLPMTIRWLVLAEDFAFG